MQLFLGDSFEVFREYKISADEVIQTHSNPDRFESLLNNVRLHLKSFTNPDDKRVLLLLGTKVNNDKEILAFAYWIPSEYNQLKGNLIDILEIFTNQFGIKVKIGGKEGYLIRSSERLISGKIENPNSLITILAPDQLPCQYFLFTSESLVGILNRVTIYYAFAINTGKYAFWINSIPTVKMEVKSGWYDFVKNNFLENIQPNGQTKITVHKQKTTDRLELDTTNNMTFIEIPLIYENQFKHILNRINNLKNDEKILFSISFESTKCLFCQSDNISKEHIFPIWIRPFLQETTFDGTLFTNFGNESLERIMESATTKGKKESSHGYTAKLACINCNNTWMSKLENEAKDILVSKNQLVDSVPADISLGDAQTLSLWLITRALLLANKIYSNVHLIKKHIFEDLKIGKINEGFLVETTTADNPKFDFIIGKGLLDDKMIKVKKISIERGKEMVANFLSCSIQLNHLLFRVSYLEPDIPLSRETTLKQTLKLFPFEKRTRHREIDNGDELWKKTIDDNLELDLFSLGLILVEKD